MAFTDTRTGQRFGYALGGGSIQRRIDGVSGSSWLDVTGGNITITNLEFVVTGTNPGSLNDEQPSVTIFIEADVGDTTGLGSQFAIQTTVVQRKLDL
jgi:hypothetical protein